MGEREGAEGRKLRKKTEEDGVVEKVRAVTEVEIEPEGRGNSIVFYRKVDDSAEREDKDGADRGLLGISFVSAGNS